jgi:hypothetical protein
MDTNDLVQLIKSIFKKEFDKNYSSGTPQIGPHQHDGTDNLQLNPINFLGYPIFKVTSASVAPTDDPISGTLRFQYDGTNLTMWIMNVREWKQIGGGGGGGGSPGGNDTNIQFNDGGNFGGEDTFTFDKTTTTVTLDDGSESGSGGGIITGGNSGIQIITDDYSTLSGYISIAAGMNTSSGGEGGSMEITSGNALSDGIPGSITIRSGACGDLGDPGQNDGGALSIFSGNTGDGTAGGIDITSGSATASGTGGRIRIRLGGTDTGSRSYLQVTQLDANSTIQPNVAFGSSVSFGGGQGVLYMRNRTTAPSSNPSSGGILYVESGALTYRGSSGTVTTIAPA